MKAYSRNPWIVENIDDFNFLCCPECAYKSKDEDAFISHAIENHPKSKDSVIFSDEESEESSKRKQSVQLKKVVKVISVPKNVSTINMLDEIAAENNQLLEESNLDDFPALDSPMK